MIISQIFFHFFLQKFILWSSKWWKQTSYQSCRGCDRLSSTSPKNHWQWSKRTCHWCAVESVILWWFKTNHHRWSSFGPCQYCHYSSFGMGSQWIRKRHTLDHSFEKFIWNPKVWGGEEKNYIIILNNKTHHQPTKCQMHSALLMMLWNWNGKKLQFWNVFAFQENIFFRPPFINGRPQDSDSVFWKKKKSH